VRRGATVLDVRMGAPATVVLGENGRTQEVRARLVVGADGRSSQVRACTDFEVRRDPDGNLIAGVLMDDIRAPEDIAHLVVNSELGQQAVIFPQGKGRAPTSVVTILAHATTARTIFHATLKAARKLE
jgi:2-polyprenyl-6-methoxyphenol hydroxylase-like FAD-dependent oxidoreductase